MIFQILGSRVSGVEQHPDVHLVESVPKTSSDDNSMLPVSEPQHDSLTGPCLGKYVLYYSLLPVFVHKFILYYYLY